MDEKGARGRTGQEVREAGAYRCEAGESWSYVRGDRFRECPATGRPTVWQKTEEPEHPGESR